MDKNLPAMQETWVRSQGRKDALEKEMVIHSSVLAWRIPRIEEPGGLQSMRSEEKRGKENGRVLEHCQGILEKMLRIDVIDHG